MDSLEIDALVASYLQDTTPPYEGRSRLYVTDLGGCLRQTVYRAVIHAEMVPFPDTKIAMFSLGTFIHDRANAALKHAGELAYEEFSLSEYLPGDWGGRADYGRRLDNGAIRLGDWKSLNPAGMRRIGDSPKPENVMQVSTYWHFWPKPDELDGMVEVGYLDRGGSNSSQVFAVEPTPKQTILGAMHAVEEAVAAADADHELLPECLPIGIKWAAPRQTQKGTTGDLMYGPPWNCEYCRVKCCPNPRKSEKVASRLASKPRGGDSSWLPHGNGWLHIEPLGRQMEDRIFQFLECEGAA